MISKAALEQRVREWGLREDIVEKDYVLGWLLWGIGTDPQLSTTWAFKGGTCLKKCYLETYRFSEDLDFSVLPGGSIQPEVLEPLLLRVLQRVGDESGINFSGRRPRLKAHPSGAFTEGRVYYQGPRQAPLVASIRLDLSSSERVVQPTVLRLISHPYPDALPKPSTVRCYSFDELFAEKIRAMGERGRPRDLYDIIHLFRRPDLRRYPKRLRAVLEKKCQHKGIAVPTFAALAAATTRPELESEWANMLGHQLPALPPFQSFWDELSDLFAWLEGTLQLVALPTLPAGESEEPGEAWSPPPTVWVWGAGVPLETIRFAAANHLCVRLGYEGTTRIIEPYSLRRTREGHLVLHALRADTHAHRSYRVDRIQSVTVTTQAFRPVYAVEFSHSGLLQAKPSVSSRQQRQPRSTASPTQLGLVYVIACPVCRKQFRRSKLDTHLNPHRNRAGATCSGLRGTLVRSQS